MHACCKLFRFNGGVKPAYHKEASTALPIAVAPLPTRLVIPAAPEHRRPPRPLVQAGDRVLKGQRIGAPTAMSRPRSMPRPPAPCLASKCADAAHLGPVGAVRGDRARRRDEWIERQPFDFPPPPPTALRDYLRDAGVVGLGGAVPSPATSSSTPASRGKLDTLVINGAECEPFITCDDVLMRDAPMRMLAGARSCATCWRRRVLVGIEDNKPEAIAAMEAPRHGARRMGEVDPVVAVPTRYPAGGAKQLIRVLTGIEVPHGERSTDFRRAVLQRRHRLCHPRSHRTRPAADLAHRHRGRQCRPGRATTRC
jgi:electron transport complex protein RnfC